MGNSLVNSNPTSKFRSIEDIFKDPATRSKLNNFIDEAVICKQKIQQHQEAIKAIRDAAREDISLDPKVFNFYVSMVYNNDYAARKAGVDQLSALIESVMNSLSPTNSNYISHDDD